MLETESGPVHVPIVNCGELYKEYVKYIYDCFDYRAVNLNLKTNFSSVYGISLNIMKCD